MKKLLAATLFFLFTAHHQAQSRFTVAAYISGDSTIVPENIRAEKITHAYYTFAGFEKNGRVFLTASDSLNLLQIKSLKSRNPKLKVLLSVGGPSFSALFGPVLADSLSREYLAASLMQLVVRQGLDGAEIHWNQQPKGMFGNAFNRKDQQHLILLLERLRTKTDSLNQKEHRKKKNRYLLALAGSSKRQYLFYAQLYTAHRYLDYINLQTYDYKVEILNAGGISSTQVSVLHSNLYPSRTDSWMRLCVDRTVREYLDQRIPSRKLVMGIPCYGNGWNNAYEDFNGLYQWAESRMNTDLSFRKISTSFLEQPGTSAYWDKQAKSPYIYQKNTGIFISYDNKKSVRKKAHYVRRHRLGGVILNDLRQDNGGLLLPARHKLHFISFPFILF